MLKRLTILLICLLIASGSVFAQESDETQPEEENIFAPEYVTIRAEDERLLYGAYFDPFGGSAPAVILFHQLYTTRHSWNDFIQPLMEAGYKVLAVDVRGYGQTRGAINWTRAQQDSLDWADWVLEQEGVTSLLMVGSSMGSSLALNACFEVDQCHSVVAISPGLNYFGVSTEEAFASNKPKLMVYAESDPYPARAIPFLESNAVATEYLMLEGRVHGIDLFKEDETLIPTLINWMNQHR